MKSVSSVLDWEIVQTSLQMDTQNSEFSKDREWRDKAVLMCPIRLGYYISSLFI
jgi:hypothetical protein